MLLKVKTSLLRGLLLVATLTLLVSSAAPVPAEANLFQDLRKHELVKEIQAYLISEGWLEPKTQTQRFNHGPKEDSKPKVNPKPKTQFQEPGQGGKNAEPQKKLVEKDPEPVVEDRDGEYRVGIDISNHQEVIDWALVAKSKEEFVYAKATEGRTYEDAYHQRNRIGAKSHGLKFGSYHYSLPQGSNDYWIRRDARLEAEHFLEYAAPRKGELRPVLDLEETGGLDDEELITWVKQWLKVVKRDGGMRAMIYASPAFWRSYLSNTSWFAENGYKNFWVAHWETDTPIVPGRVWGGYGWSMWQWTNCKSVPGIEGCVDGNRYQGSLERIRIGMK